MGDSPRERRDDIVSEAGTAAAAAAAATATAAAAEQLSQHPSPPLPPRMSDEESQSGCISEPTVAETTSEPLAELSASLQRALSPLPPPTYGEQCSIGIPASMTASTRIRFLPRELPAGMRSPSAMSPATMETHVLDVESPGATLKRKTQGGGIIYFPPENLAEYLDSSLVKPVSGGSARRTSDDGTITKRRAFFDECGTADEDDIFASASPRVGPHVRVPTPRSKVALFYCAFCMRNREATDRRRFTGNGGCSHEFCKNCLENYLFQRIMVGHHSLHTCPKFGEESCRSSASSEDIRRIVGGDVYEAQLRRLEGLSGACEECGHRGRRPSKHFSPSTPLQPAPLSPSTAAAAAAAATAAREEADARAENTCQSCGSALRRHLHLPHPHLPHPHLPHPHLPHPHLPHPHLSHHHQKRHLQNHRKSPRRASAAAAAARTQRKDSAKTPRGWRKQSAELRREHQQRAGALLAGGADTADESKRLGNHAEEGEETAGAPSTATATATIRCRGCPTCGHRQQRVSYGSSDRKAGRASTGDGTKNSTMTMTTRPTTATTAPASPATAATTLTAARQGGKDVQDNLVVCDACGGAWCWLCGRSASDASNVIGGRGSRSGGYSKANTEQEMDEEQGKTRDRQEESGRKNDCVASGGVVRRRGRLEHFSRWNVTGCPGARHTSPKGWDGECLPLYRTLVAILVAVVGPVFLVSRAICWLVGVMFAPVCCAFGEASRDRWRSAFSGCRFGEWRTAAGATISVADVISFPLAVALSLLLAVAWIPLGLVAAAVRWLWTSVAFVDRRPDGDGGGGGGGRDERARRVALARKRRAVSAAKAKSVSDAKTLKLVVIAPAVVLSRYLASWWWRESNSGGGGGGDAGDGRSEGVEIGGDDDGMLSNGNQEQHSMRSRPRPTQREHDLDPTLEKTPVLLTISAAEGDSNETPPLTASSAKN